MSAVGLWHCRLEAVAQDAAPVRLAHKTGAGRPEQPGPVVSANSCGESQRLKRCARLVVGVNEGGKETPASGA
jgi:hypothetical protein